MFMIFHICGPRPTGNTGCQFLCCQGICCSKSNFIHPTERFLAHSSSRMLPCSDIQPNAALFSHSADRCLAHSIEITFLYAFIHQMLPLSSIQSNVTFFILLRNSPRSFIQPSVMSFQESHTSDTLVHFMRQWQNRCLYLVIIGFI